MLLLHGFGDTPQTLSYLARYLNENGYDVRVPLLRGHGRSIAAMDASTHMEWLDDARAQLYAMRARYDWVAVGGLSMGGSIAALLAAEVRDLPALVLISPYLAMPLHLRLLSGTADYWNDLVRPFHSATVRSILDPVERAANLAYGSVTGHGIHELSQLVKKARAILGEIVTPTLYIQSEHDNRSSLPAAQRAFAAIGAEMKKMTLTHEGGHIITVDYGRAHVFEEIRAWLGLVPEPCPSQGVRNS
ncbi:MAG: alpha/beta fold hydrolase [Gemmatimonadaceae bacterium]